MVRAYIELWRPEKEQILSVVAIHSCLALLGIRSRLYVKLNFDWLTCATSSCSSTRAPETADVDGHQSPCVWM